MAGWLYDDMPNGILHVLIVTVILGGAAAVASGRAIAGSWKSFAIVPVYMVILSAALRFLQYALFQGDLLSIPEFVVTLALMLAAAGYGYRAQRTQQMVTQYSWLYSKAGPLGWTRKVT